MQSIYTVKIIAQNENAIRFSILKEDEPLTFQEVFNLWEKEAAFIKFYVNALISIDYTAFYWEHPALKTAYLEKRYECILQRSQPLEHLPINEKVFSDYIYSVEDVVDFMNLGKNARLVVPTKKSEEAIYNHLGKFIRLAEEQQVISVFNRIGKVVKLELENQEFIWLNTAGLGVIWTHIRMDTRPKYYKTANYRRKDFSEKLP